MRMLHTSDWHLGRTLHGVDLLPAQAAFLDALVEVVRAESVDVVVVAGDVYDRAVPPVEAVALLEAALCRLSERCCVVLLSGNHDSGRRLGFGSALFREGVHVRTQATAVGQPVELSDGHGPVLVYAVPYLDPDATRAALADGDEPLARCHEAVLRAAMARVRADLRSRAGARPRSVVAAHAFVVGSPLGSMGSRGSRGSREVDADEAQRCESERDIRVGGVDAVPAAVFAGIDYAALGHLHGAQRVTGPQGTVLRYAGSPLPYSFSEEHHTKGSWLVDLGPHGVTGIEQVPAPVTRRVRTLRARMDDVLGRPGEPFLDDWLRVVVTDDERPPELYRRIKQRFPHALQVLHEPATALPGPSRTMAVAANDPLAVIAEFVELVGGRAPDAAESAVLGRAYELALAELRSA